MKKTMLSLFCLALLMGACTNENALTDPTSNSGNRTVTFSLGAPGGEPVTYAQVHETDEYAVSRLDIFQFNAMGALVEIYADVATSAAAAPNFPARKTVAQITLPQGTTGAQEFLFVANLNGKMVNDLANKTVSVPGTVQKAAFMAELTKSLPATNADLRPDFLMTGSKTVTITNSTPMDLTADGDIVMLTRAMARIDVGIRLKTTVEVLTITKISFGNSPANTTLYPVTGNNSPTTGGNVAYKEVSASTAPALTAFFDGTATANYTSRYKKLFYPYERNLNQFAALGTPTLYISADYKPTAAATAIKMRYEIPFDRSIVRNYLYTVILGVKPDGDKYETTTDIRTLKWEDEVVFTSTTTLLGFTANASLAADFTYDNATHVLTLKSKDAKTLTDAFTITSQYADDDLVLDLVKTGGPIVQPNNDWISATTTAGKITLTVTANPEGAQREGVIWFKSKKDTGSHQLYAIKVVQPA